jgi:hypothetical protein
VHPPDTVFQCLNNQCALVRTGCARVRLFGLQFHQENIPEGNTRLGYVDASGETIELPFFFLGNSSEYYVVPLNSEGHPELVVIPFPGLPDPMKRVVLDEVAAGERATLMIETVPEFEVLNESHLVYDGKTHLHVYKGIQHELDEPIAFGCPVRYASRMVLSRRTRTTSSHSTTASSALASTTASRSVRVPHARQRSRPPKIST